MPYDLYWYGDPYAVVLYHEANELYKERRNQEMFLQGMYNFEAFKSVIDTFSWQLGGGKGKRPELYREYPYSITDREKKAEQDRLIRKTLEWVKQGQRNN